MNKIISLFLMVFLIVGLTGFVVAEDTDDDVVETKKVGFFEDRIDRIRLAFTFNDEKKIDRALVMAEKRLAEAEFLAEEDPEAYARVQERYDELVAKAEEALADIESRAEDGTESIEYMETLIKKGCVS